jgi:flagellar biosynthetic protein FliR
VLVFARLVGVLSAAPGFAARVIPVRVRIGAAVVLTPVLLGLAKGSAGPMPESWAAVAWLAAKELAVGLGLGFVASLLFYGVAMAGQLAGRQAGFYLGPAFDPRAPEPAGFLGSFYYLLAAAVFVSIDGHHWLVSGLARSFEWLPVTTFLPQMQAGALAVAGGRMFLAALLVGAPPLVALLVTDVAVAMLSRAVPAFAPLAAAIAVRPVVGLVAVVLSLPLLASVISGNVQTIYASMMALLGGGP